MFHQVTIVGNLGKDPEMRYTPAGQAVTSFNVASNRTYTSSDGTKVKETIWFRISVWGKQAEVCSQYLKKGRAVLVTGRLQADPATGGPRIWAKNDGTSGASFEVTADTVRFLGGGQGDSEASEEYAGAPVGAAAGSNGNNAVAGDDWDDL